MKKGEKILVFCPACKKKTVYSTTNVFRPFCSERCKLIDLGEWANESYKIPIQETNLDWEQDQDPTHDSEDEKG